MTTPTTQRIECGACRAPLVVSADPPTAAKFLAAHGWTNVIATPSKRERVVLHDGTEAVVERPAGAPRTIGWCCGVGCAGHIRDNIAKPGGDEHSRGPADLARAGAPADKPARIIPHASCATCLSSLELDYETPARRAEAQASSGWRVHDGSTYCSATCVRLRAARTAISVAPVTEIADVAYQADRTRKRAAAGLATPTTKTVEEAPATPPADVPGWKPTPITKGKAKH